MSDVTTKTLLKFCFEQMRKLDEGEISLQQAREQANLIKQANNLLRIELMAKVTIRMGGVNTVLIEKL